MAKYYRNNEPALGIDEQALWERKGDMMILVDQDQYVTHLYNDKLFYPVPADEANSFDQAQDRM
ncbi:MAG: hypothetical protein EOM23_08350 [Candidatus Moranbacteria bacterium]|nr:hypothetical protein [Candidatus Moranbacteria bacterium]